jgi:hypothetical protein
MEKSADGPRAMERTSSDEVREIPERQACINSISPEAAADTRWTSGIPTVPLSRASTTVARGRRQCEKAAGRAADRGPSWVQASCQSDVEHPSRGSTLVMERYSGISDWKHFQAGVAA